MSQFLDQLKHLGKSVSDLFKKEEKRPIRMKELTNLIIANPESKKKTKTLLGLVFNFYVLKLGAITLKLETKGKNDDYILELTALDNGETLFSYKSYEDNHSIKDKHLLPEYVHAHLSEI
ncbi:hypothetical protein [Evansella cellulosilytica]|uniref:Uncharacterized protein n=1 Tax=Evansella cellulosilytica (strain ATCC 21833 / DSM 2522 / FERM P-1141 / JCM 9156 / N-4) TaxID=649639 RepID=E6U1P0_EVAC2|nr:hypothetical protein [Evansella cellulosilytica]ADU30403.1 hypothetical protein Bcell_2142 [Evansella cellulosilytica DSM 2522]